MNYLANCKPYSAIAPQSHPADVECTLYNVHEVWGVETWQFLNQDNQTISTGKLSCRTT